MKNTIAVLAAGSAFALALASAPAEAQMGPGYGMMGPGGGPGYGMMGPGYGVPGSGGYGYGYGMHGMGPGVWGGMGSLPASLNTEQRAKIAEIQRDVRKRQWPLMQQMHELMWGDATAESAALDEQAQRRDYDRIAALQKQMFETMLDSRKRIEAVLTPQQREEMQRRPRPAG